MSEKIILTEEQIQILYKAFDDSTLTAPSISELSMIVFGQEYDSRDPHCLAIKRALSDKVNNVDREKEKAKKEKIRKEQAEKIAEVKAKLEAKHEAEIGEITGSKWDLTREQKLFVENNCEKMRVVEMARDIHCNKKIFAGDERCVKIAEYMKSINKIFFEPPDETPSKDYIPPKSVAKLIDKINLYAPNANWTESKLSGKQKKDVQTLMGYLNTFRYAYQMNSYDNMTDRSLFESTFIRHTYDKSDLTEEEVDQYISAAIHLVNSANIKKEEILLHKILKDSVEEEDVKISMSLQEAISNARKEFGASEKNFNDLINSLKVKRSERMKQKIQENASILNLVQLWKDEESRKKLIHLANIRNDKLKEEIDRLGSMDGLKATILGISEDEIING